MLMNSAKITTRLSRLIQLEIGGLCWRHNEIAMNIVLSAAQRERERERERGGALIGNIGLFKGDLYIIYVAILLSRGRRGSNTSGLAPPYCVSIFSSNSSLPKTYDSSSPGASGR